MLKATIGSSPSAAQSMRVATSGCNPLPRAGAILFWIALFSTVALSQTAASPPYFDESPQDRVLLGNSFYELALSKLNGAILALTDKSTGAALTLGSRSGCLWAVDFETPVPSDESIGGCAYQAGFPSSFAYSWDPVRSALILTYSYDPLAARLLHATVAISASSGSYFDMQIQLRNRWGAPVDQIHFPDDLLFQSSSVQAGYLPFLLPGVRLLPAFFTSTGTQTALYPGAMAFMDFLALEAGRGQLALYTVNPSGPIQPVLLGFTSAEPINGTFGLVHAFQTAVPNGTAYTSPFVRIRVGQSVKDSVLAFRTDNGVANYPAIQQKLGNRFDTLIRAPAVKAEVRLFIGKPFLSAIPDLDQFPSPALLHPLAFQPGGHDQSSPDYLPPDPQWGTTANFAAWTRAAQSRGLLTMPYINPTWWNPQSPTVVAAGSGWPALAVTRADGSAMTVSYGPHDGIVICPFVPLVKTRLGSLMEQFRIDVPADYMFADQIGSRPWVRDFNPVSPTPISYSDGWLAFWNSYSQQGMFTEDGWDRLALNGVGLMGSPLTGATSFDLSTMPYGVNSTANMLLGPGNWDPYPLATWLMHDKALFYEKDLPEATTSENTEVVTFDLEFGYLLKYLWPGNAADPPAPGRIELAHLLHRTVVPLYAGNPLSGFMYLAPEVHMSTFGDLSVIANWQPGAPYTIGGNTIIPGGYMASTPAAGIIAGAFTQQLNGCALTPGDHYVVIDSQPRVVSVWQPVGSDTPLSVNPPSGWMSGHALQVVAVDRDFNRLSNVSFSLNGARVQFNYAGVVGGTAVDHYEIVDSDSLYPGARNAASLLSSPVAPGEVVTLNVAGLGVVSPRSFVVGSNGTVETKLAGIQVLFDGVAAPLIYAGANEIIVAVPYSVAGKAITTVQIISGSNAMGQVVLPVAASAPGIFTADGSGSNGATVLNQDGTPNLPANPAAIGSVVTLYATGEGQTAPAGLDGAFAGAVSPVPLIQPRVQIGGAEAEVVYAGGAQGMYAGIMQVKAKIPAGVQPGSQVPIVLVVGHSRSAAGVTIAIR